MRAKSKELLDNLNKIVENPKNRFERPAGIPDTNKMWKSVMGTYNFPKSYEKGPWTKEVEDDGDIDYWTPYDRIYGGLHESDQRLIQKDGTEYKGKLHKKRRLIKGMDGNNFYQQIRVTADDRWFDNCGMPIEPPTKTEDEEEPDEISFGDRELTDEEKEERAKWKARAESDMLKKLK
jgi:hypothetical protein